MDGERMMASPDMKSIKRDIVVVGAGITGMKCAIDFAGLGYQVLLVDRARHGGGILTRLDHQFPNDHCGMCRMLPMIDRGAERETCLRKGLFHENIETRYATEVHSVSGKMGDLRVSLTTTPSGVNKTICSGCGRCESVCPVLASDRFNGGLNDRKAIFLPTPHLSGESRVIDWEACTVCGACVEICPTHAISLDQGPQEITLSGVLAVVVASGIDLYDPSEIDLYGYGHLKNVVTAMDFERIMSSSGPFQGEFRRPSDGKPIRKIAWVQCVGSRNVMIGADCCASVCCMFAVKEAVLAREKMGPEGQAVIFYMDMRSFGRDYQRYRDRAEHEKGVRFERMRIHSVLPFEATDDLMISYVKRSGEPVDEVFDLVVLSTGRKPQNALPEWAQEEGVFPVMALPGFKDISDSVVGASAISEQVARLLHEKGLPPKEMGALSLPEASFTGKRPSFLIVFCSCNHLLDNRIHFQSIEERLKALPGAPQVLHVAEACSEEGWRTLEAVLSEGNRNRCLVAACGAAFDFSRKRALETELGFPVSFIDLLDVISLSRRFGDGEDMTGAVEREIQMGLDRLSGRMPVSPVTLELSKSVLVVGGGPAGVRAASLLSSHGVSVKLVEKSDHLGGKLERIEGGELKAQVEEILAQVEADPRIEIFRNAEVVDFSGRPGGFTTRIRHGEDRIQVVTHGATILATGGFEMGIPDTFSPCHERIITGFDMECLLNKEDSALMTGPVPHVVMIQCVGSREEPRNYCSRICCLKSLKNAMKIKEHHPQAAVTIFYRDMMTYGDSEALYTEARKRGIMFIPFEKGAPPRLSALDGKIVIEGYDSLLSEPVRIEPDWVSLATGVIPSDVSDLKRLFSFSTTEEGFIREADTKWRPVDTGKEGIFVCGLAKSPSRLDEVLLEAGAAAARALRILGKERFRPSPVSARVRHAICSACGICISVCPFGARFMDPERGTAAVDPLVCQGCGLCAAECPNNATLLGDFEDNGIMGAIEAAF